MAHQSDKDIVEHTHNTARYFTEVRHVSWTLLVATILWGIFAYARMPKAKDPVVAVRVAVATCVWPGASAERIEQLVTKTIEAKISENSKVEKIESVTRSSVALVYVTLKENVVDRARELEDIKGKLDGIRDLPEGAGPVQFIKDFGEVSALLLTVASPRASEVEVALRSRAIKRSIEEVRAQVQGERVPGGAPRVSFVVCFPPSINSAPLERVGALLATYLVDRGFGREPRIFQGVGYLGADFESSAEDAKIISFMGQFVATRLRLSELHPDVWQPIIIRDPKDSRAIVGAGAGDRYSYRELADFTSTIQRYLQNVPVVSKVTRSGVLPERVYLEYSQERLASYGVQLSTLKNIVGARNITYPGGVLEIQGKNLMIDPSGEIHQESELGNILLATSAVGGTPLYLRDVMEIGRAYESPPRYLNYITVRDKDGHFQRSRAITLSVQMRTGEQIAAFGAAVNARLAEVQRLLPDDLIIRRTSDQPLQVKESVELFMSSLYEAILLVVLVALVGFWEWRSALVMALCIPITLAMTFGLMNVLGLDVQQISISSLILALGLLVDDPVVAGDAIKRSLGEGWPRVVAAWLGPTKLASAIMFATITNIVAYLPFLTLPGDVGNFIFSLPVVLTCSLVASRLVSMSFVPLLAYYILRPNKARDPTPAERRSRGFAKYYSRVGLWAIRHRKLVLALSFIPLFAGFGMGGALKQAFFPKDLSYLSYVDVWLPEDATFGSTRNIARQADEIIRKVGDEYGKLHPGEDKKPLIDSVTTFVGGGGPRFWFSVNPELQQLNYAQLIIQTHDKHNTRALIAPLQDALSRSVAGARIDVRELENGKPVGIPISVRISGDNLSELRAQAERVKTLLRGIPIAERVRDDWGAESFNVKLEVDSDRANMAGVTNADVAISSAAGMNGTEVGILRDGENQIPIVARLRSEERAQLSDIQNLYVISGNSPVKVPLRQVSKVNYSLETERIRRRNQFRTITVAAFPAAGYLPSEVMKLAQAGIEAIAKDMPPGYHLEIGGEQEEQLRGFGDLAVVMGLSVFAIFIALVLQFKNAVKPLIVFAAIPYGIAGAIASLAFMGSPFGFMAFLGIISLIGVIVSHIIVLFDFIEEMREKGEPLEDALIDAGILRLRPVLITVGATVLGLVPLALHGGPLWEPLCFAQIGGLTVATILTLLLVPVLYATFVLDLHWVKWEV